jgi:hypothetical protein
MTFIPNETFSLYNDLSQVFIDELGKTVTIYFISGQSATSSTQLNGMNDVDVFGNPSNITDFAGGNNKSEPSENTKENVSTSTIKARIYQLDSNNFYRSTNIRLLGSGRGFKMISYKSDLPKLMQAAYIEVESTDNALIKNRAVLAKEFAPYGLGDKTKYVCSYWKII